MLSSKKYCSKESSHKFQNTIMFLVIFFTYFSTYIVEKCTFFGFYCSFMFDKNGVKTALTTIHYLHFG